jgi:hypothetical protein
MALSIAACMACAKRLGRPLLAAGRHAVFSLLGPVALFFALPVKSLFLYSMPVKTGESRCCQRNAVTPSAS